MKAKSITGKILTGIVIAGVALGALLLWRSRGQQEQQPERQEIEKQVNVVVAPLQSRVFEERLTLQGNVEARHFALVSPRVGGTLDAVYVREGDRVIEGETRLFQTDKIKLEKALEISRRNLEVARHSVREREANLERVEADFHKAELDYHRYRRLYEDDQAVTRNAFEIQESRYLQTQALLKHARTLVDLAREQQAQAETALAIAEKDLRDSLIVAPLSGVVSQRLREPGEMGEMGKPVIRIEDLSVVEINAFLPSEYYARIVPGETRMRVRVNGVVLESLPISYRSPTIQPGLRTFEVKGLAENPPEGVTSGALAEIDIVMQEKTALGIPNEAIVMRSGRPVVFLAEENRARMITVETGLEMGGYTEIITEELAEGSPVVIQGQTMINDGVLIAARREAQ